MIFTGNPTPCSFTNKPLLKQINRVAYDAVESAVESPIKQQSAQIYGDLTHSRPTTPLLFTANEDLVYLFNVMDRPNDWRMIADSLESSRTLASITDQTKNIQHIRLSFGGFDTKSRLCAGCEKLTWHTSYLSSWTEQRLRDR